MSERYNGSTKWLIGLLGTLIVTGIVGTIGSWISISEWKGRVDESINHLVLDAKRERELIYQQLGEIKASLRRLEAK